MTVDLARLQQHAERFLTQPVFTTGSNLNDYLDEVQEMSQLVVRLIDEFEAAQKAAKEGIAVDYLEGFAADHGLPAMLDHIGLDGLGNQVNTLKREIKAARKVVEAARKLIDDIDPDSLRPGTHTIDRLEDALVSFEKETQP
jgi:hypothetical protein